MGPNYSRPKINEEDDASSNLPFDLLRPSQSLPEQVRSTGLDPADVTEECLLICCPTVAGFSLNEKLWGEIHHPTSCPSS
ncbi:hypothetical protein M501DRAFT_994516 [Patellaria atrata CBS 101060]|uniref:Uncharacterized protein n=1 Tax=Patellaria atrata CBS 101060 TaxID=1346257 RepID=A0A9P4VTV1_9PEZI|nr:hypothetical protein M501DRAFT_994516 [Patellaria atrata CBS 101060]